MCRHLYHASPHLRVQSREQERMADAPTADKLGPVFLTSLQPSTLFFLLTLIKVLLFPTYKSTDFDVHRNWLSITRHLPLSQWYFNDVNGTTAHTLDYPPSFAYFEYILANNVITNKLVENEMVDSKCFELLGDHENDVGYDCVVFQRSTVIVSDIVLFLGAFMLSKALFPTKNEIALYESQQKARMASFLLVVCNPGLIILDHIHFQYNGMLLGILLASLSLLVQSIRTNSKSLQVNLELVGAVLYSILLTFKHLYLTLGPMYFFYLLGRFCFTSESISKSAKDGGKANTKPSLRFSLQRLVALGIVVSVALILPFVPFLFSSQNEVNTDDGPKGQMLQILARLFPFQRGLCHDYWAGNIWALYLGSEKVLGGMYRVLSKQAMLPFPTVSALTAASCLLISLTPAMISAWHTARSSKLTNVERQEALLYCVVYSALSSFMFAYHVHEKAVLTAILPMTYLAVVSKEGARLFLRMTTIGHFGLLPLLFRPQELILKVLLLFTYLTGSILLLEVVHLQGDNDNSFEPSGLVTRWDKLGLTILVLILAFVEVIHPLLFPKKFMEFLPLMMISIFCAIGLFGSWIYCGRIMLRYLRL